MAAVVDFLSWIFLVAGGLFCVIGMIGVDLAIELEQLAFAVVNQSPNT